MKIQNNHKNNSTNKLDTPDDWEVKTISEAFEICNNLRLPISKEERKKRLGQYPYYGPTKILDYINEYRLDGTYALIGEDGDHFLKWKELPMTLLVSGKFNVNNHAHIIQGKENLTEWFFYYFNQRPLTPQLTRQGAGRYKLTKDALKQIPCALPPLPEQLAIAACLTTWDKAIATTQKIIEQKQLKNKWLTQNLLTGKKRLKGFNGEWKEYSYSNLLKVVNRDIDWDDEELYNLISVRRRSDGIFFRDALYGHQIKVKSLRSVNDGDFLFSKMQIVHGASALVTKEFTGAKISGSYIAVVSKNRDTLNMEYFNWYSKMPLFYHHTYISSYGVHIEKMTFDFTTFLELKIKIPSIEEQTAIAQILQTADKEIELLQSKLEKLREQKKGLMQVLLTGKKRLNY